MLEKNLLHNGKAFTRPSCKLSRLYQQWQEAYLSNSSHLWPSDVWKGGVYIQRTSSCLNSFSSVSLLQCNCAHNKSLPFCPSTKWNRLWDLQGDLFPPTPSPFFAARGCCKAEEEGLVQLQENYCMQLFYNRKALMFIRTSTWNMRKKLLQFSLAYMYISFNRQQP